MRLKDAMAPEGSRAEWGVFCPISGSVFATETRKEAELEIAGAQEPVYLVRQPEKYDPYYLGDVPSGKWEYAHDADAAYEIVRDSSPQLSEQQVLDAVEALIDAGFGRIEWEAVTQFRVLDPVERKVWAEGNGNELKHARPGDIVQRRYNATNVQWRTGTMNEHGVWKNNE